MPTRPQSSRVSTRATISQDTQAGPWLTHFAAAVQATPRTSERSRARASTRVPDGVDSPKPATSRTAYHSKQERDQPEPAQVPLGTGGAGERPSPRVSRSRNRAGWLGSTLLARRTGVGRHRACTVRPRRVWRPQTERTAGEVLENVRSCRYARSRRSPGRRSRPEPDGPEHRAPGP